MHVCGAGRALQETAYDKTVHAHTHILSVNFAMRLLAAVLLRHSVAVAMRRLLKGCTKLRLC
jgi:hypothetical protein